MTVLTKSKIFDITEVSPLENYRVRIKFEDGIEKEVNIKPFIGKGISKQLEDPAYFKLVKIEGGTITWPNGYDFCPLLLRDYLR